MTYRIGRPVLSRGASGTYVADVPLDWGTSSLTLHFDSEIGPLATSLEAAFAASLFPAMMLRQPLRLEGPISPRLLESAVKLQEIYHTWARGSQIVSIDTHGQADLAAESGRGVAAFFSGGLDSFYTVLRHIDEIDALIFVHGYDIRLQDQEVWDHVYGPVRAAADELGKPLIKVATNAADSAAGLISWSMYHGSALASVALLLAPVFRKVYIGGTHSYRDLIPWGSHPLLDPLWSTEDVAIVHDGSAASRVEKAILVAGSDAAMQHLRVCFRNRLDGPKDMYNCGECEKCLRTKINLHLAGALDRCATLDHELDLEAIAGIQIPDASVLSFVQENLEAAEEQGADAGLIDALRDALRRNDQRSRDAEHELDKTRSEMAYVKSENLYLRTSIEAIHRSDSWRITAPLRALGDLARSIRPAGK